MIELTRRQIRRLRGILRRSRLGIAHRGPLPPIIFRADGGQLRAQYRYDSLAVEHVCPGLAGPERAIPLPLDALADCEGRDETPVTLEAAAPDRTVLRWEDGGIPCAREFTVIPPGDDGFPALPASWSDASPELLEALAEAAATTVDDSSRYALSCVALRGPAGELVATDGRQLLIQGGFSFPWAEDLLVRPVPSLACKELLRDGSPRLGRTGTDVGLRVGPWTVLFAIRADARFPDVTRALPDLGAAAARLRLDPADAAFLATALDRLPGSEALNAPATLDLNGRVAVRARDADRGEVTELVLARSSYTGEPIRVSLDRNFLARAARLGLPELEIVEAHAPVIGRSGQRIFGFQPLHPDSAVVPCEGAIRIDSVEASERPAVRTSEPKSRSVARDEHAVRTRCVDANPARPIRRAEARARGETASAAGDGLPALIRDAEELFASLGAARARARGLITALRRQRKRERLLASTLRSLRQLRIPEPAGTSA